MKNQILLFLLTTLIIFSCNEEKRNKKIIPVNKTVKKSQPTLDRDFSKSAKLFAKDILKENIRTHRFELDNLNNPKHLKIFQSNGLKKIIGYSNKKYPKKSEPNYYEHFILFVATYDNQVNAQKAFNEIKSYSKYKISESKNLTKELSERVNALNIGAKSGGLIVQKGNQIFSLVETCRNTPIGGKWIDYENKFLNYISNSENEIEVLNADCGNNKYKIEKREASR